MRKGYLAALSLYCLTAWLFGLSDARTTTHAATSSSNNNINGVSSDVVKQTEGACKSAGMCTAYMCTDSASSTPASQCAWGWGWHRYAPVCAAHQHKVLTHAAQQHLQIDIQPLPLIWPVIAITVIVACCLAMQLYWAYTTQPDAGLDPCGPDYSKQTSHTKADSNTSDHHSTSTASCHSKAAAGHILQNNHPSAHIEARTNADRKVDARQGSLSVGRTHNQSTHSTTHSKHSHVADSVKSPATQGDSKSQQEQGQLGCHANTSPAVKLQAVTVLANYPHAPGSLQEDRQTIWTDTVENVQYASEPVGPSCLGFEFSRSNTEVVSSVHHSHVEQQQQQRVQTQQGQQQPPSTEKGQQPTSESQLSATQQHSKSVEQQQPQTAVTNLHKHQALQLTQQQWLKHDPELQSRRTEMLRQVEQLFSNRSARQSRSGGFKQQQLSRTTSLSQPITRNLHFVQWHGTLEALQALANTVISTTDHRHATTDADSENALAGAGSARKTADRQQQQLQQQPQGHQTKAQQDLTVAATVQGPDLSSTVFLLDLIGSGASGQVFRGFWHGEEVAVKTVLFQDTASDSTASNEPNSALHHAIREAAVCNTLVHPHVVFTHTYDIAPVASQAIGSTAPQQQPASAQLPVTVTVQNDWKLFLVQELCHANLHAAVVESVLHDSNTKAANMAMILPLLLDIASGMEFIHSKNIIHGDLKPENVLLKAEPAAAIGMVAKVTDFGLCKTLHADQYHITGYRLGTPFYAAPEVVQDGQLTKASDVYSFGVLMWVLYRCMPPWVLEGGTYTRNMQLGRYRLGAPAPYVLLTIRCMATSPSHRPTFTEIRAALMGMLHCYHKGWHDLRPQVKQFPVVPAPVNQHLTQQSVTQTLMVG